MTHLYRKCLELFQKYKEAVLYIFFGGLTTVVSIISFAWCDLALHMNPLAANVISWILSVTFAYVTNRLWVFRSMAHGHTALIREAAAFYGGRLFTLGAEETFLFIFINGLGLPGIGVKIGAQIFVLIANYIISKWMVFTR